MEYKGIIISESLENTDILKELNVVNIEICETATREATPWLSKWTLNTIIILENEIEDYSEKLSKLIDKKHSGNWYCDFRNDIFHYVIFSDKVFKIDITKKDEYTEMRNYGIEIGISEKQLPNFNDLPVTLLVEFLIEAKKQTYANSGADKIVSSRLGSKDYEYSKEIEGELMTYHDTYFGAVKFIGEEVVYRGNNNPKWAMNYYGFTLDENISEETMDKALRPALMKVGEDASVIPVRGPARFENEDYLYTFNVEGEIENFKGVEEVYKNNKLVYKLYCHGGIIE